jgi:hypothetical protein
MKNSTTSCFTVAALQARGKYFLNKEKVGEHAQQELTQDFE